MRHHGSSQSVEDGWNMNPRICSELELWGVRLVQFRFFFWGVLNPGTLEIISAKPSSICLNQFQESNREHDIITKYNIYPDTVCHICLHWGGFRGQCRHIFHTWSVWDIVLNISGLFRKFNPRQELAPFSDLEH